MLVLLMSLEKSSMFDAESAPLISNHLTGEPVETEQESGGPWSVLPASFWILCLICMLLYGTVIPFNTTASDFLISKWYHGDIEMAGLVMR